MSTPKNPRSNTYSKKILKLAAQDASDQEQVWLVVRLMEANTEQNPLISQRDLRNKTIQDAIDNGMDPMMAERYYRAASQVIIPFMNSGEKLLRADALIDGLVAQANKHLIVDVYGKDGQIVGTKFSADNMNAIIKALNVKLQTLTKVQHNLILAQKESQQAKEAKDFELSHADTEQLERFVTGEIKDHPELIDKIFNKVTDKVPMELKGFHEELNDG